MATQADRTTAQTANPRAKAALILGIDTAAGAYLARLLDARGYRLAGTGGTNLVKGLGIGDKIDRRDAVDIALLAEVRPDEIYDLRHDTVATTALLDITGSALVFVAASPGAASGDIARAAGRFVVTGTLFPHESRLGPGTSAVARLVAAAAAGNDPDAADLASTTDCGWTPEYVDAMTRMLQQPVAADFVIATGRSLSGVEAARHACEYFGRDASRFIGGSSPVATTGAKAADTAATIAAAAGGVGDPRPATIALGWRAVTWGRDLVRVLCEGVAAI